jgi:hypothetical protein
MKYSIGTIFYHKPYTKEDEPFLIVVTRDSGEFCLCNVNWAFIRKNIEWVSGTMNKDWARREFNNNNMYCIVE